MAVNNYTTKADIKRALTDAIDQADTQYDALLDELSAAASRAIDRFLGKKPGYFQVDADVTLWFDGSGKRELWIEPLAAAPTSVKVAETGDPAVLTTYAASNFILWPYNALDLGIPYTRLDIDQLNGTKTHWYKYPKNVEIIGKFGWSTSVPDDVKRAATVATAVAFKKGQQAFQTQGAFTAVGQLEYERWLDEEVRMLLQHSFVGGVVV